VRRAGTAFSIVFACLVAGASAAAVLADTPPGDTTTAATTTVATQTVPTGVTLAGVQIGGMTSDAAVAAVTQAFEQPVVLHYARTTISVAPSVLGLSVPVDSAVAVALTAAPGTSLALRASVNKDLVQSFVAHLAGRFDRKPVSSQLLLRAFRPYVTPSSPGVQIDQRAAVSALTDVLVHGTRTPIALRAKLLTPGTTERSIGPVVVIRRGSNTLTLYNGMKVVRTFHVATGQQSYPTPLGRFQIVVKWRDPWWYPPASPWAKGQKPVPPGPGNPLGTRWMGISSPGVGIHGTPDAASIGYSLSHGCIRMLIPQAEWLFDHVDIGTPVFIVAA
jgi:lipoprotein-anchoring transpeptidase ErfK/SrfK